jgi:hypothetical protein
LIHFIFLRFGQGVTKRCRLSWLTNSSLVHEPKCGGKGGVAGPLPTSTAVQINFGDLTPYLTYGFGIRNLSSEVNFIAVPFTVYYGGVL